MCVNSRVKHSEDRKTWRLWHATDFESLMYLNFQASFLCGFFPYKRESSGYVFSKTRFVFSTLVILAYITLSVIILYHINFTTRLQYGIPGTVHANTFLLLNGSIIVLMYTQSHAKLRMLQSLSEISEMLSPEDFNGSAKLIHTKDLIGLLFIGVHFPHCFRKDGVVTLRHITAFYSVLTNFSLGMFYMNCVCVLKACFRKLNENLSELKESLTNDELYLKARWTEKSLRHKQGTTQLLLKLKRLQEMHLRISNTVQLLNKAFLIHNILIAVSTFTIVTFNTYFYILWMNEVTAAGTAKQFWFAPYLPTAVYHMIKFTMIIWACETAKREISKVGVSVHEALNNATDTLIKHELQLFSLQVLHQDNTFSAKVITLNTALLAQIIGGIAMYILILFQFLLNFIMCQKNA